MRRAAVILLIVVAALLVGVAGALWYQRERGIAYLTDADTIRRPVATTDPRDVLWRPPEDVAAPVNTDGEEYEPRLSADGNTLFFVRGRAGANADIHVARRTPGGWSAAAPLGAVDSEMDDLGPEPTADGRRLYFYSNREGGAGGYDLWVAERADDDTGWLAPANLGPAVNTTYNEYGPAVTPEGTALYFASNRPRPDDAEVPEANAWPATVREDLYRGDYDLSTSPRSRVAVSARAGPSRRSTPPTTRGRPR